MMRLKYLNKLTFSLKQSKNKEVSFCDIADISNVNIPSHVYDQFERSIVSQ